MPEDASPDAIEALGLSDDRASNPLEALGLPDDRASNPFRAYDRFGASKAAG